MREELIDVAIRQFGENGFDGTSTRQLAGDAGTTMSNITYHFGGKEGLYQAAGEEILDRLGAALNATTIAPLSKKAGPTEAIALIDQLLENMGGFILRDEAAPVARFIAREHDDPTSEFSKKLGERANWIGNLISDAIGRIRPDLSAAQCRARAFFIYSLIIAPRNAHGVLRAIMGMSVLKENEGRVLLDDLKLAVHDMLRAPE